MRDEQDEAAYFYWSRPVSNPAWGQLEEFPLAYEGWDKFARKGFALGTG